MTARETTFDEVASAAQSLRTEGRAVDLGTLRALLPDVAPTALFPHLGAWRAAQAQPADPAVLQVPPAVSQALDAWAQQLHGDVAARARDSLAQLQGDLDALLAENAQALGRLAEREARIARLTVELRQARDIATDALVSKAKDNLAIDGKDAQIAELRGEIDRHLAGIAFASDARLAAQMELVGAVTARDKYAVELADLRSQLEEAHRA